MRLMPTRLVAVLCVLAGAAAACGLPTDRPPSFVADEDVPFGLLAGTTTTAPLPAQNPSPRVTEVCFVRDASVVEVARPVNAATPEAALAELRAGPTAAEQASGVRTALLTEDPVEQVAVAAGVAKVELTSGFAAGGTQDTILAVAQLVCTLTGQAGVGQVAFTLEGAPVEVPRGDGTLAAGAVTRDDYASVLAPPA
jgi:hypothetical protein